MEEQINEIIFLYVNEKLNKGEIKLEKSKSKNILSKINFAGKHLNSRILDLGDLKIDLIEDGS